MEPEQEEPLPHRLDTFNARDMSASQVASRFVPLAAYRSLVGDSNTLLIGPRGSGKTTLLKMVTPEALEMWPQQRAALPAPNFSGIYVPIDVQLADILDSIRNADAPGDLREATLESVYGLHVFKCILASLSWHFPSSRRRSKKAVVSPETEARLIDDLAALWSLSLRVPTVGELQLSLRRKQIRALEAWGRLAFLARRGRDFDVSELEVVAFDASMKAAVEVLSRSLELRGSQRWALLFDELEVAPEYLQRLLLTYLRFSDETILFKVAISPYMFGYRGVVERGRGSALNDYNVIDLQSISDRETTDFSNNFFARMCVTRGLAALDLEQALGDSVLTDADHNNRAAAYGQKTDQARRILSLARKDPSFADYLEDTDLIVSNLLDGKTSDERAPFRKVRQVALVRDSYLSDHASTNRLTKARTDARRLYVGGDTVIRLCEGNPRRLAFIVPLLLDEITTRNQVPTGAQVRAIETTEVAFRSFLRGLPVSGELGQVLPRGVLSFIDLLGAQFHGELVGREFNADPSASFIVDSATSPSIQEIIARCCNAGALVQISDSSSRANVRSASATDPATVIQGKRFRLSYVLAPGYGLLLRRGRAVSLNYLLQEARGSRSSSGARIAEALLSGQGRLF